MLLRYIGEREIDLNPNHVYEAKKVNDVFGECYAIFDDGDDRYIYDANFVKENFVEFEEKETAQ